MGFWDVVKSVATGAKCTLGWHAGDYTHIHGKPECFMEKTCPDCNKYVTTKKHKFGEWSYIEYGSCASVRRCEHCDEIENETRHQYKAIKKDENCVTIEECGRCSSRRNGSTNHNWVKLFDNELKVNGKRKCKDCGYTEE